MVVALWLRMGRGETILRKMGSLPIFVLSFFIGEIFWGWLLFFTGNVYFAIVVSVVGVSSVLYLITFRLRQQTGRWWFVPIDRSRFVDPPRWNTATAIFWKRIERE